MNLVYIIAPSSVKKKYLLIEWPLQLIEPVRKPTKKKKNNNNNNNDDDDDDDECSKIALKEFQLIELVR